MKIRLRYVAIWIAVLAIGFALARNHIQNDLVLRNETGQTIDTLSVRVCGQVFPFEKISPGATNSLDFRIKGDGDFEVSGRLADGTSFHETDGYVTGGMRGVHVEITIRPGGRVAFDQSD